jgi:hypothetical protein
MSENRPPRDDGDDHADDRTDDLEDEKPSGGNGSSEDDGETIEVAANGAHASAGGRIDLRPFELMPIEVALALLNQIERMVTLLEKIMDRHRGYPPAAPPNEESRSL